MDATIVLSTAWQIGKLAWGMVAFLVAFYLPGHFVCEWLLTEWAEKRVEKALLAVGISLIFTVIIGLSIFMLPEKPATWVWLLPQLVLTGVFAMLAGRTRRQPRVVLPDQTSRVARGRTGLRAWIFCGLLVVGALFVSWASVRSQPQHAFTQLWLLPQADHSSFRMGVKSFEDQAKSYQLALLQNGTVIDVFDDIHLNSGETWEKQAPFPAPQTADDVFEVLLFDKDDLHTVYRSLRVRYGQPVR